MKIYHEKELEERVKYYRTTIQNEHRWDLANKALYDFVKEHPGHINEDEIVAKLWLIGRTYAASIERRKKEEDTKGNDDFYYEKVAPSIKEVGEELDKKIAEIQILSFNQNSLETILKTHYWLMKEFNKLSGKDNRSLASKYLHFHCPKQVMIYDSRATDAVRSIVHRRPALNESDFHKQDLEYTDFCERAFFLMDYLKKEYALELGPRELDKLLLNTPQNPNE